MIWIMIDRVVVKDNKILGHLEQEILESLWERREASGKEIFDSIRAMRDIALTTVLTVLERLTRKGLVRKIKGQSVYLFRPEYNRDEFARKASAEVFKGIISISASGASASFVDMLAREQPLELERLSALIDSKKKELTEKGKR